METPSRPDVEADLLSRLRGEDGVLESAAPIARAGLAAPSLGDAASAEALNEIKAVVDHLEDLDMVRLLNDAIQALHAGDYSQGETLALEALGRDEQQGVAWHVLGVSREKLGDFGSSMRCYEAALKLLPDHGASPATWAAWPSAWACPSWRSSSSPTSCAAGPATWRR